MAARLLAQLPRFLPVFIGLAVLVVFAIGLTLGPPQNIDSAYQDKPLPDFSLPPLFDDAPPLTSADLKSGQPVLLNVFASWCAPCRVEHPQLMQLRDMGVPIFAINYKDGRDSGQRFLNRLGNPYRAIGFDKRGQAALNLGVYGVPETFIIDEKGRVILRHVGPLSEKNVREKILPYFKNSLTMNVTERSEEKPNAVPR